MHSRLLYIWFQRTLTSWYSVRRTLGTSMLCVEGQISSYDTHVRPLYKSPVVALELTNFFPVKI